MTEPISAEDVIARIDDWQGKDVRVEVLGGGITNRNYLVTVGGDPGAAGSQAASSCASPGRARRRSSTAPASCTTTPPRRPPVSPRRFST